MTDTVPTPPTESPAAPRLTRRRRDTRQRLIAAAYEVFTERGIRDSPVELICERAGFTRGAFYSNFATKEELFLALYQEENDARMARMRASLAEAEPSTPVTDAESVRGLLSEIARVFVVAQADDRTWYLLTSEFRTQALRQPDLLPRVREAHQHFTAILAELLTTTLDRFGLRLAISPVEAAHVLIALYEDALHRALLDPANPNTIDTYATEVIPQVIATLLTPIQAGG